MAKQKKSPVCNPRFILHLKTSSHRTFPLTCMAIMHNRAALFFVFLSLCPSAQAQFRAPVKEGAKRAAHHTQVSLLTDVKQVRAGVPFTAGVLMKMDKGWHTYWKYAGESGLPTNIEWKLPEGFSFGNIQWPLPNKYNESGDVLTYGYADENMLLIEITPPNNITAGSTVSLRADVSWLECEKLCVPGDARVELKLPITESSEKANPELFEKYRSQIPDRKSVV